MDNVGLLFVGAVLFVNGLMLLGVVEDRAAIPLNVFVGLLQVVTPTYLIMSSNGNTETILFASGLYLFGFTYLYVACNLAFGLDPAGLGWFSLFVVVCAIVFAGLSLIKNSDPAFAVIWLAWAFLWSLFFLLLGRGHTQLERFTGFVCVVEGWLTAAIPALLLLTGLWPERTGILALGLALVLGGLFWLGYRRLGPASVGRAHLADSAALGRD